MEQTKRTVKDYADIIQNWLDAWNSIDPERVAGFYNEVLDYRDPTVPEGITTKEEFIKYLRLVFQVWPEQKWIKKNIYPQAEEGSFTADYEFSIGNAKKTIRGRGIDRIVFKDGRISLNHVYLNADKWKEWIRSELQS